jgi:predicted glycosyltransferase
MCSVLFYSKGRGRGHAVRDIAIAEELVKITGKLDISFASYATGADAFREAGKKVIDLGLPEFPSFPESVLCAARFFNCFRPKVVVAQEEIAALTAAKIYDIPTIFQTHWFPPERSCNRSAYQYADHVLFTEEAGLFREIKEVAGRVKYVGPVMRELTACPSRRHAYRAELGLDANDLFILVMPGSHPERQSNICTLIVNAFKELQSEGKNKITWVAGTNYAVVSRQTPKTDEWGVVRYSPETEKWMVASDLLITKGTYNITREAEILRVPSVAITHGVNPVDDVFADKMSLCDLIRVEDIMSSDLAAIIKRKLDKSSDREGKISQVNGARKAAETLARWIK